MEQQAMTCGVAFLGLFLSVRQGPPVEASKPVAACDIGAFRSRPYEYQTVVLTTPRDVRSFKGQVTDRSDTGLPGAVVEIRLQEDPRWYAETTTDEDGAFEVPRVPAGRYCFKVSRMGFESIVGTVGVSDKAPKGERLRLSMNLGT